MAVAIGQPLWLSSDLGFVLTDYLVHAVGQVLSRIRVDHLCVEGGETASALVRKLGWNRLPVVEELAPGVVSMQVPDHKGLRFTAKPGSYAFPAGIVPT